jgi:hypothetical protein
MKRAYFLFREFFLKKSGSMFPSLGWLRKFMMCVL